MFPTNSLQLSIEESLSENYYDLWFYFNGSENLIILENIYLKDLIFFKNILSEYYEGKRTLIVKKFNNNCKFILHKDHLQIDISNSNNTILFTFENNSIVSDEINKFIAKINLLECESLKESVEIEKETETNEIEKVNGDEDDSNKRINNILKSVIEDESLVNLFSNLKNTTTVVKDSDVETKENDPNDSLYQFVQSIMNDESIKNVMAENKEENDKNINNTLKSMMQDESMKKLILNLTNNLISKPDVFNELFPIILKDMNKNK